MAVIMLTAVKLVDQWRAVEERLPEDWQEVRLRVRPEIPSELGEVARILGPMTVGRVGAALSFTVERAGGAAGPQAAHRLFGYLDDARVWCVLETDATLTATEVGETVASSGTSPGSLADAWDAELGRLPGDWSDLLAELEIDSSDDLDRVALLCAPMNPARDGDRPAFTFRCARVAGYGVAPMMARRCFERLDETGLGGRIGVLRVLSDTDPVGTQGPTWIVAGKVL